MHAALRTPLALLALAALAGCPRVPEKDEEDSAPVCEGPSIVAGADLSISLGAVATPSATGTICLAGEDVTYSWVIASVPIDSEIDSGDLTSTDPAAPTFVPDVVGTYVLSVAASDSTGATSPTDYLVIVVTSGNAIPLADCGRNQTATVSERVEMDGSGSSDPEGAGLEFAWSLSSKPTCSALGEDGLFNGASSTPSVVPDCAGVFVVGLAVSDGESWSAVDFCSISVAAENEAPVADAGNSGALSPCTERNYELDGYGSYDPEGTPLSYEWSQISGPAGGTFDDVTLPNPIFRWTDTGTYIFQLQVSDGELYSPPDVVSVTFTDEGENNRPVANAGDDQTITTTPECTTASYVFTCDDCEAEDVDLDGSASDDPMDGDDLGFLWSDASGELTLSAPYAPVTTAITPVFAATYNVAITRNWEVVLAVSDCADSDSDTVNILYTCTGEYSP